MTYTTVEIEPQLREIFLIKMFLKDFRKRSKLNFDKIFDIALYVTDFDS